MEANNLSQAFEYVNQRYVFNRQNYATMKSLSESEAVLFSLKHCLLQMQGLLQTIMIGDKMHWNIAEVEGYRKAVIEVLVNIIKISSIVNLDVSEIPDHSHETKVTFGDVILSLMNDISIHCTKLDRHNNLQDITPYLLSSVQIKETTLKLAWCRLFYLFDKMHGYSLKRALLEIPTVMKSKYS